MKIYVASHKYAESISDDLYVPLFVGSSLHSNLDRRLGWFYDDECVGALSSKNEFYCELTGQFWITKESTDDIIGLCHYRRFFRSPSEPYRPINSYEIDDLLSKYDCIVAKPFYCLHPARSAAQSVAEQYRLAHCSTDIIQLQSIINRFHPFYVSAFEDIFIHGVCFSPFNMIICSSKIYKRYSKWLFSVLFELERRVDFSAHRDTYQRRALGFLAERLLNVYIKKHKLNAFYCDVFDPNDRLDKPTCEPEVVRRLKCDYDSNDSFVHNGLDYSSIFDPYFYLTHYEDLNLLYKQTPSRSFDHFVSYGLREGRMAHPKFSIRSYMKGNQQLLKQFGSDEIAFAEHFINSDTPIHGIGFENLLPSVSEPLQANNRTDRRMASFLLKAESFGVLD